MADKKYFQFDDGTEPSDEEIKEFLKQMHEAGMHWVKEIDKQIFKGIKLLSPRKKKRFKKWIFKALKKE